MGKYRDAMQAEMQLRGFAPRTQRTYTSWMKRLVLRVGRPADQITEQQARAYVSELSGRGLSASTINQAISAVRFFFHEVLRRDWDLAIHYQRAPQRVPVTLTPEEVARLLAAVPNLRDRTTMEIAYASGLRLGEVLHLKLTDIDSGQMIVRVEQGKGKKDRNVMLSPALARDAAVVLEGVEATSVAVSGPRWEAATERDGNPESLHAGEAASADCEAGELPFVGP